MDAEQSTGSDAMRPVRRTDKLIVREVGDELVAYALDTEQVTALDPTTAQVWQHLTGDATVDEIAKAAALTENDVATAIDRLDRAGLMAGGVDRRRFLRLATASAGAMALMTIAAPAAMAAGSSATLSITTTGTSATGAAQGCSEANKNLKGTVSGSGFPAGTYNVTVNVIVASPSGSGMVTVAGVPVSSTGVLSTEFTVSLSNVKKNSTTSASANAVGTGSVSTVARSTKTSATSNC